MKAFLISSAIFAALVSLLVFVAFLILIDTSPMGKMEYLYRLGRFTAFRYTGIGGLSDNEVKLIYEGRCTRKCHSRDAVERSSHTAREWEEIAGRMKNVNKAKVTNSEIKVIIPYLARHFGSNIPTILTAEGGKYLKKYLWRSDFGESDIYIDIIYTPIQYFNIIGGSSVVEGYKAGEYEVFKVYINTHQDKLAPFPLDQLSVLKAGDGMQHKPALWKVIYESADYHHREGMLIFKKSEDSAVSMSLILKDLPGQKKRLFQWDLPIPEK